MLNQISKTFNKKLIYAFSTNPYYILGVNKNSSFDEIKKSYYKLAAQYHPDINKSPSAPKQFMLIKESFEKIKQARGEGTAQVMEGDAKQRSEFKSVRKDSKDYEETWNQEQEEQHKKQEQSDYREFVSRMEGEEEGERLGKSFQTLHDIKEDQFKPIDMEVPDASKRFNLDNVMKLKVFSDGSNSYIGFLGVFAFIFFILLQNIYNNI